MCQELPDVQSGFRKGRGTRDQITNICWIIEKQENSRKTSISFTDYVKAIDSMDHNKLQKILKEMGKPDHLPASWETCMQLKKQVRTRHGTMDWFKIGKGLQQGCTLPPCFLNLYASCKMPGWMKHKLEPRQPGEIWITSDMQMTALLRQKVKN